MTTNSLSFEQGPIRPPNEARSLLLRVTRNCPWNQCLFCPVYKGCLFCPVYKGRKFSLRTVDEIKQDIQTARDIADDIKAFSLKLGCSGKVDDQVINSLLNNSIHSNSYQSIAVWMYYGTNACFLQDADNLIMKTGDLVDVLKFLKEKFPEITRITTYTRSRTVVRKSVESLMQIRKAGLDRIHIGLETGYDPLLKLMKKGVSSAQHIEAGQKAIQAGMELSEYVMPGLGGQEMWKEHAIETARVLNKINPHFIRDTLNGITSTVTSDHIMNLLEEVSGKFPGDKEKMLDIIKEYQELSEEDRLIYRVGRRGGTYRSTNDLKSDPATYQKIKNLISEVKEDKGEQEMDKFIAELVDRYV